MNRSPITLVSTVTTLHVVTAFAMLVFANAVQASEVTRTDGGSVQTDLGHNIVLNEDSSLTREWVAVHDEALPVAMQGTPGIETTYESRTRYTSGGFRYKSTFQIDVHEPLAAIEIRFLTFDVWGEHMRSLQKVEIVDLEPGEHTLEGTWRLSENDAARFYASIAYISRVRTKEGRVLNANPHPVVSEARRFSEQFSDEELVPEGDRSPTDD